MGYTFRFCSASASRITCWKVGNYEAPPEKGIRLRRDILSLLSARTPDMYAAQFKNGMDVLPGWKARRPC